MIGGVKTHHLHCAQCPVRDEAACSALSGDQRDELARIGRHGTFAPGETVFAAGEDNDRIATLISGLLKVSEIDADGTEHIVSLIHPAGFVGELFAPSARFEISALTDARLCLFGRKQYEDALTELPELSLALLRRSAAETSEARAMIGLIGRRTAKARLAGFLTALSEAAGTAPCRSASTIDLPISREEIAALLGLTIETVSRQFGALEKADIIRREGRRQLTILDLEALHALTE